MTLKLQLRGDVWYAMGTLTRLDGKSVRVKRSTKLPFNQKKRASALALKIEMEVMHQTDEIRTRSDDTVSEMNKRYLMLSLIHI